MNGQIALILVQPEQGVLLPPFRPPHEYRLVARRDAEVIVIDRFAFRDSVGPHRNRGAALARVLGVPFVDEVPGAP